MLYPDPELKDYRIRIHRMHHKIATIETILSPPSIDCGEFQSEPIQLAVLLS